MSVKVARDRFIVSSVSKSAALYQHIITSHWNFQKLGKKLIREAESAQALRQHDKLEELSLILSNLPPPEYRLIGQYYLGWIAFRRGEDTRTTFEKVIENSATYRSKALIDLATIELNAGNCDSGIKFCAEAIRQSDTVSTMVNAVRSSVVIKSTEGLHIQAIKDLEAIHPLVRYASPITRHQYLNSLAVEYGEVGRIEEASNICKVVLASPYGFAYPEWRETADGIALRGYKSRSSVSVIQSFLEPEKQHEKIQNVLYMPGRNAAPVRLRTKPAKVLSYVDWKEKMAKEEKDEIPPDADEGDLYLRLMELIAKKDLSTWELRQVIDFVEKLRPKSEKN